MAISISETADRRDIKRWWLIIALGMSVLFWRVLLPTYTDITVRTVILVAVLDLILTATVVLLARKELKEASARKFRGRDFLKALLLYVIAMAITMLYARLIVIDGIPLYESMANAPAQWVATEYRRIFPLGIFLSTVVAAPVWEEIVFRMTGKKLFRNPVLFVAVTSCLFAFIHTVNFSLADNLDYFLFGVIMAVSYLIVKDIRIMMLVHLLWNGMAYVLRPLSEYLLSVYTGLA